MDTLDRLFDRLTSYHNIERAAHERTLHTFLFELEQAATRLGADPRRELLSALQKALRVDLAFLVQHPEATFTCLQYRLAAHAQLQARLAQREVAGTPWLKSLRAPEHALYGALVEEYRADAPGNFRRLRLNGELIELLHGPCDGRVKAEAYAPRAYRRITWNRITGERSEGETIVRHADVSPNGRVRIGYPSWGKIDVYAHANGAKVRTLSLDNSYMASNVAYASDAQLIAVSGCDDDCGGFVAVYDLESFSCVMLARTDCALFEVGISARGKRVAASGALTTYVWNVEDSRLVCQLPLRDAVVAPLDAELLMTAERGVVRNWNLRQARSFRGGYRSGLSNAAFSPNGERLMTGTWLVDARTGAQVAQLDFERLDYFEGGPPKDAFVLGNEHVVSLERGVRVWDAQTGNELVQDGSRGFHHGHLIALTACGKRYAWTRRARPERPDDDESVPVENANIVIVETESGNELARFGTSPVKCMAWTPDGETLATGSSDGRMCLWSERGELLRSLADQAFKSIDDVLEVLQVAMPRGALPWTMIAKDGSLLVVDRASQAPVAWFPADERVIAHPHEPIWAGGAAHLKLVRP